MGVFASAEAHPEFQSAYLLSNRYSPGQLTIQPNSTYQVGCDVRMNDHWTHAMERSMFQKHTIKQHVHCQSLKYLLMAKRPGFRFPTGHVPGEYFNQGRIQKVDGTEWAIFVRLDHTSTPQDLICRRNMSSMLPSRRQKIAQRLLQGTEESACARRPSGPTHSFCHIGLGLGPSQWGKEPCRELQVGALASSRCFFLRFVNVVSHSVFCAVIV